MDGVDGSVDGTKMSLFTLTLKTALLTPIDSVNRMLIT